MSGVLVWSIGWELPNTLASPRILMPKWATQIRLAALLLECVNYLMFPTTHDIIQTHSSVPWDWKYVVEYFIIRTEYGEYYVHVSPTKWLSYPLEFFCPKLIIWDQMFIYFILCGKLFGTLNYLAKLSTSKKINKHFILYIKIGHKIPGGKTIILGRMEYMPRILEN